MVNVSHLYVDVGPGDSVKGPDTFGSVKISTESRVSCWSRQVIPFFCAASRDDE